MDVTAYKAWGGGGSGGARFVGTKSDSPCRLEFVVPK